MPVPPIKSVIQSENNSERLTRKRLIDPKLKAAGWKIIPFSVHKPLISHGPCAIEEFETANGPADYALCVDGRIVGTEAIPLYLEYSIRMRERRIGAA
jgi:predicted type IV restriction endonuclease